jgi:hypothetical protein
MVDLLEYVLGQRLQKLEIQNESLKQENNLISEENVKFCQLFQERFVMITNFIMEFQKNIQDLPNFQKNKHEVLRTLKELNEKNVRYEKEIKRLGKELNDANECIDLLKITLSQLENNYSKELQGLKDNLDSFLRDSLINKNKKRLYEFEKKLALKDEELSLAQKEQAKSKEEFLQKLNQKQIEFDLLKVDYQNLLNDKIQNDSRQESLNLHKNGSNNKNKDTALNQLNSSFENRPRNNSNKNSWGDKTNYDTIQKTSKKPHSRLLEENNSISDEDGNDFMIGDKNQTRGLNKQGRDRNKNIKKKNKANDDDFQNELIYRLNKYH